MPTQGISNTVCLPRVVKDLTVIVFDQFKPSSLLNIEVFLSEDIFKAFMICEYLTFYPIQVVLPKLQGENYHNQFEIMLRVVLLMLL